MNLALVDADTIYYRAAFKMNKLEIRRQIDTTMLDIEGQTFASKMRVAIKGWGNFRKDLYPAYKSNRVTKDDLKEYLTYGHEYMKTKWEGVQADGMEADDLVAIWAYEARDMEIPFVICGIDKDLKQIPGNHYNYHKSIHEFIDDDTAYYNLMLQCLTGDSGDNIPGIKGIGPKKAERILAGVAPDRYWDRIRAAWRGHGAGDPTLSRTLLTMLKSWEEYEDIKSQISSETTKREQDVRIVRGRTTFKTAEYLELPRRDS